MNANANYPSYLALPDASPPALQRSPIMPAASPAPSYESALSKRAVANQNHRFSKQDRYNEMRRLEDEEKEKSAHQQKKKRTRTRQRKNDYRSHTAQLQATPPPAAHDMTRDPSNTALLRQQLENTTIHDPSAQSGVKKGKGGRKPGTHMEPVAKAHANFMRQSGTVCPSCRTRKVKCDGKNTRCERRNDPRLEWNYQMARQSQGSQQQLPLPDPQAALTVPTVGGRPTDQDVVGTGQGSLRAQEGLQHYDQAQYAGPGADPEGILGPVDPYRRQDLLAQFQNLPPAPGRAPATTQHLNPPSSDLISPGPWNAPMAGLSPPGGIGHEAQPRPPLPQYPSTLTIDGSSTSPGPSSVSGMTEISIARDADCAGLLWECTEDDCKFVSPDMQGAMAHYGIHRPFMPYDPLEDARKWWCKLCKHVHSGPEPPTCSSCAGTDLQLNLHAFTAADIGHAISKTVEVANPGSRPAINPSIGQRMSVSRQTSGAYQQYFGGGPPSSSGYSLQSDAEGESGDSPLPTPLDDPRVPRPDDTSRTEASDEDIPCAVSDADAILMYTLGLRRPLLPAFFFQWSTFLLFLVLLVPVLANFGSTGDPLAPGLDQMSVVDIAKRLASAPSPSTSPTSCIFMPKPSQPSLVEVICWSERQSHKFEMPLEAARIQIRQIKSQQEDQRRNCNCLPAR